MLAIGDPFPALSNCDTTHGQIVDLRDHFGSSWVLFVTQSCEDNPVGTTELGELERLRGEFEERNVKIYVLGTSSRETVEAWPADIHATTGYSISFPIIIDDNRLLAEALQLQGDARHLYFVDPDACVRLILTYPASTGFSSFEILRCFDSLSRTSAQIATPVNWVHGRDCLLTPNVKSAEALRSFPAGVRCVELPSGRDYLRLTPDPLAPSTFDNEDAMPGGGSQATDDRDQRRSRKSPS